MDESRLIDTHVSVFATEFLREERRDRFIELIAMSRQVQHRRGPEKGAARWSKFREMLSGLEHWLHPGVSLEPALRGELVTTRSPRRVSDGPGLMPLLWSTDRVRHLSSPNLEEAALLLSQPTDFTHLLSWIPGRVAFYRQPELGPNAWRLRSFQSPRGSRS
jgi:hypothetical protein